MALCLHVCRPDERDNVRLLKLNRYIEVANLEAQRYIEVAVFEQSYVERGQGRERMMKKALVAGLAALALAMAPQAASAAPFTGTVGYGGVWTLPDADGFDDESELGIASALVLDATGTFAAEGMGLGTVLDHASPLVYDPPTPPAGAMWTDPVSGISFYLTSMAVTGVTDTELILEGVGYFSGAGYDDTEGVWALTAQRANNTISRATYSADSIIEEENVPEPATLALLGFGLIGAGVARRRSRR